ncbi:MAG TPA: ABC transporter permease, partial [Clostridium sp.]|nr:ABC transporter permease [Clostridium sp.]
MSSMSGLTYPVTLFAGVLVIMMVVSASIQQRRSDLALFSLQGATPMQLTLRTCAQVLLLDAAASVISLFISPQLARLLFSFFAVQLEAPGLPYTAVGIPRMVLSWSYGIGIGFVVAVVGAFLTIRTVSRISPVEALR